MAKAMAASENLPGKLQGLVYVTTPQLKRFSLTHTHILNGLEEESLSDIPNTPILLTLKSIAQ